MLSQALCSALLLTSWCAHCAFKSIETQRNALAKTPHRFPQQSYFRLILLLSHSDFRWQDSEGSGNHVIGINNLQELATHRTLSELCETAFPPWRYRGLKGCNSCCFYYRERTLAFLKLSSMQDNMLNFHHGQLSSFHSHDTQLSPRLISRVATLTHHAYQHEWQSAFSVFMAKVSIRQRELDIKVVTRFHKQPVSLAQAQQKSIAFSKKTSSESMREKKGAGEGERETKNRRITFS